MRWYWAVMWGNAVPNPFVADVSDLMGFDEWDFFRGEKIREWNPSAWLQALKPENDGVLDDVLQNLHALPIYSSRLRHALEAAQIGGVQYLPVRVSSPSQGEINGFAIANILNVVPALDFDRTEVEYVAPDFPVPQKRGQIADIRKVTLRGPAIKQFDVIRLREYELRVYVSERFRDVFQAGGFTGYSFREVRVSS